jgi:hypothetical protein
VVASSWPGAADADCNARRTHPGPSAGAAARLAAGREPSPEDDGDPQREHERRVRGGRRPRLHPRSNLTAGAAPAGDWQSANSIPDPAQPWPHQAGVAYGFLGVPALPGVPALTITQAADLPANVYGVSAAPGVHQLWHDQHLKLEGPVVATIEQQFAERWVDQVETTARLFPPALGVPKLYDLTTPANYSSGQVIFSTAAAYNGGAIVALPQPQAVPALAPGAGASRVQMWRTIPLRTRPNAALFTRGEFTVMAGISNAVQQATELIWMYDQYFWSKPLARQLNARLVAQPRTPRDPDPATLRRRVAR